MEAVYGWAKNLIFCLCLLELFCHLVRAEDYRRYIRFFGGMIVMVMVFSPLADILTLGETFDEALRQAFAREEAQELQMSQEALADLQSDRIAEAYKAELQRQMEEIALAHGQRAIQTEVKLEEKKGSPAEIAGVRMVLSGRSGSLNVFEKDEEARAQQIKAAGAIQAEIAAVYGIEAAQITVSVKE